MLVEEIGGDERYAVDEMRDALVGSRRAATDDAGDRVPLREQELGEIGAVLAGDSSDQCVRQGSVLVMAGPMVCDGRQKKREPR
jgi:hypothetical protein